MTQDNDDNINNDDMPPPELNIVEKFVKGDIDDVKAEIKQIAINAVSGEINKQSED